MSDDCYQPFRLKDLAVSDRPQERLEQLGPGALSDTELLAMLLRSGSKGHNVITIAQRLIAKDVDIDLLGHVIVGRAAADPLGRGFYSFRESGVL